MSTANHHLASPKYRPDIDGLRAVAILSVLAFHAFPIRVQGGFIGVDVFFVISGFLISSIIFENLDKGTYSFTEFYARRIRRIFPALLLVLAASYLFGWFALLSDEYKQLGKHIAAGAGFVSNWVFWNEAGYFDNAADTKPLLHLWSLGIEEQFYIVWPLVIWFAWKSRFNLFLLTISIATLSFYLNIQGVKKDAVATFYAPQTRFWELLSGTALAWFTLYIQPNARSKATFLSYKLSKVLPTSAYQFAQNNFSNILSFSGCIILTYGFWHMSKDLAFPGWWALIPTLSAILIILAGPSAWINRHLLSSKLAVWFGLISFPLYLWHWPLLSFTRVIESQVPSIGLRTLAILLSIVLAWMTYQFIERPFRFGGQQKFKVAGLVMTMILVGSAGYSTFLKDGFEYRASIQGYVNNKNELVRTPAKDDACLEYIGFKNPLFPYCRYTNANSQQTIAVIGDSHAHVAYPGIAEYLKDKGKNTLLLANSACPPFIGSTTGNTQIEQDACKNRVQQLLATVKQHQDIQKVFIFTRGPIYMTGREPLARNKAHLSSKVIPLNEFTTAAEITFKQLAQNGKQVFYITENPELSFPAESCLSRPFKSSSKNCAIQKNSVLQRQRDYLMAFNRLSNVKVINSLDTFCPQQSCILFDDRGALLYADDDHLSIAGSRFLVAKLLKQYLDD